MKIDLSSLPTEFIDGINEVKIVHNFKTGDECDTEGAVFITHKDKTGYKVVCGGSYMNKTGVFNMYPLIESKEKKFYRERTFSSLEQAWNTFAEYNLV